MKSDWSYINNHRMRTGTMASDDADGPNGAFTFRRGSVEIIVIASVGMGWEHVSARARGMDLKERVPTWAEMCWLRDLFFDPEEVVIQIHPKHSEYVNCHPNVLHLWRPTYCDIPTPPTYMLGPITGP